MQLSKCWLCIRICERLRLQPLSRSSTEDDTGKLSCVSVWADQDGQICIPSRCSSATGGMSVASAGGVCQGNETCHLLPAKHCWRVCGHSNDKLAAFYTICAQGHSVPQAPLSFSVTYLEHDSLGSAVWSCSFVDLPANDAFSPPMVHPCMMAIVPSLMLLHWERYFSDSKLSRKTKAQHSLQRNFILK